VLTTDDAQVTVILAERSFAAAPGQRSVRVRVEPLAPSAVDPPAAPTQILGNVYLLEATYAPSGEPAPLEVDARVVLVYPLLSGDHGGHEVLVSRRGTMWTAVDTNDLVSIQQADGPIDSLGYVAVGGSPAATVTPSPSGEPEDDGSSLATFVIVASIAVLVIGVAVALWPRRPSRPAARGGRGSRRFR
jgi:hypothetical protein